MDVSKILASVIKNFIIAPNGIPKAFPEMGGDCGIDKTNSYHFVVLGKVILVVGLVLSTTISLADPARHTSVQRVTFNALNGRNVSHFLVYYLHNPSMDLSGMDDTGITVINQVPTNTYLIASQGSRFSALRASLPWKIIGGVPMVSNGFVGVSDGWTDLLGGAADTTMDWTQSPATNGNVAQMGWIVFGASTATSISFYLLLGFGSNAVAAMQAVFGSLTSGGATLETNYVNQWQAYNTGLMPIILAWKLGRNDLWSKIKQTADYIVATDPRTNQERWEENSGYLPSTIAAEIAGLVCAAEIARANGDLVRAGTYYAKADERQQNVDAWTFTTTGSHGNAQHYIRSNADQNPNDVDIITIGAKKG